MPNGGKLIPGNVFTYAKRVKLSVATWNVREIRIESRRSLALLMLSADADDEGKGLLMITVIFAYVCLYVNIFAFTKIKAYKSIHLMKSDLNERHAWRCVRGERRERGECRTSAFLLCAPHQTSDPRERACAVRRLVIACKSFAASLQRTFLQNTRTHWHDLATRNDCCRQTLFSLFQFFPPAADFKRSRTFNNSSYVECGSEWKLILNVI